MTQNIKGIEDIYRQFEAECRERAKEPGKCFGECESCGLNTCLVADLGLCGPCCFGEAETANGNW